MVTHPNNSQKSCSFDPSNKHKKGVVRKKIPINCRHTQYRKRFLA